MSSDLIDKNNEIPNYLFSLNEILSNADCDKIDDVVKLFLLTEAQELIGCVDAELLRLYCYGFCQYDAESQYELGLFYKNKKPGSMLFENCVKWFIRAAEQGHTHAQYELWSLYKRGLAGDRFNATEAFLFLKQSATSGNLYALREIADIYITGKFVPRNLIYAYKYLFMALILKDRLNTDEIDDFQDTFNMVSGMMSFLELHEAKKIVQSCSWQRVGASVR